MFRAQFPAPWGRMLRYQGVGDLFDTKNATRGQPFDSFDCKATRELNENVRREWLNEVQPYVSGCFLFFDLL
jgi:hypothetical protein